MAEVNRVVVVTGASHGIGSAIALRFGAPGTGLVLTYRQRRAGAEAVAAQLRDAGAEPLVLAVDVRSRADVERMVEATLARFGRIDVLVNNAGIYPRAPLLELSEALWDEVLGTNLKGSFLCAQAVARAMIAGGVRGKIVNISSIEGVLTATGMLAYDVSKAGVLMLTRNLALELGPYGINVNCVAPGLIDAPDLSRNAPVLHQTYLQQAVFGLGSGADVADACLFLASDAARWITGQTLFVDGGMLVAPYYGSPEPPRRSG